MVLLKHINLTDVQSMGLMVRSICLEIFGSQSVNSHGFLPAIFPWTSSKAFMLVAVQKMVKIIVKLFNIEIIQNIQLIFNKIWIIKYTKIWKKPNIVVWIKFTRAKLYGCPVNTIKISIFLDFYTIFFFPSYFFYCHCKGGGYAYFCFSH